MDIKQVISQMTLEEKASLLSGLDFWHTKPVERLGIPSVMVSDGPHGLRKQDQTGDHLGSTTASRRSAILRLAPQLPALTGICCARSAKAWATPASTSRWPLTWALQ